MWVYVRSNMRCKLTWTDVRGASVALGAMPNQAPWLCAGAVQRRRQAPQADLHVWALHARLASRLTWCPGRAQEWYEGTTKHRKLTWMYALGNCSLKANFDARPVELILSTFQAALLLLFNDGAAPPARKQPWCC